MTEPKPVADDVLIRNAPLGGSALSRALRSGDAGARWLAPVPSGREAWGEHIRRVRTSGDADWASRLAPAFAAHGAAAERLARAAARGVVVTTGQQPGLFGGPTYTFTKAIGALAFADALEEMVGVPVAPVFWAATDDADWLEASVTHVIGAHGLETLHMPGPATDGVSMSDVPLGDVTTQLAALRDACGSAAGSSVLDMAASAYTNGATVGAAYVALLRALLEPLGIAVLDASHPALRDAARPVLQRALREAPAVRDALHRRTAELRDAGFEPQVETLDELSLVFEYRARDDGRSSSVTRERVPIADAARVAADAGSGALGANVLLRPVLERCLLPTVAYFAGPGEFAYFAQVPPIAEALRVPTPVVLPRWSGEVVERRSADVLERLALDESTLQDPHAAERLLARNAMGEELQDSLERLRVTIETQSHALRGASQNADVPMPPTVVEGLQRDLQQRVDRFERRLVAGVKRRETSLMRDIAHVRAAFRPLGTSPERVLNLLPVLARHGVGVLERLRDAARPHAERLLQGDTRIP